MSAYPEITKGVYYKATLPDGFDFYSQTVEYVPGFIYTVVENERRDTPALCSSSVIHASASPAETLIGGHWPCRLFEVHGSPVVSDGRKSGFVEFEVVREVPALWALGPNGQAVAWVTRTTRNATAEQLSALAAAWDAAWAAARDAAWAAARAAAWDAARAAARDAAWAAARAAVVADLITPDQYDLLYGPFRTVFGDPP